MTIATEEIISREGHQALAMLHARAIRSLYSRAAKEKARKEVLHHLRASLRPAATERV